MAKAPPNRRLMKLDKETEFLHRGITMLQQLDIPARRRLLEYWSARYRVLPLCNAKGVVIDDHPVDPEPDPDAPPILKLINELQTEEVGA